MDIPIDEIARKAEEDPKSSLFIPMAFAERQFLEAAPMNGASFGVFTCRYQFSRVQ